MMPGGMDPKKMQGLMRQMGIKSEEIQSNLVTIKTDSGLILIENPQVVKITMQGQSSFQISGTIKLQESISNEDIKMVMEQANCTEEAARSALKDSNGDIAQAIVLLSESDK